MVLLKNILRHRYKGLKRTWDQNSPLFSCHNFNDFFEKEPCTKFCGVLISCHEVMKLQSSESGVRTSYRRMFKTFHSWFSLHIFVKFTEKEPFIQFFSRYKPWIHEVVKFWIIKLCFDVSDAIHTNKHT